MGTRTVFLPLYGISGARFATCGDYVSDKGDWDEDQSY